MDLIHIERGRTRAVIAPTAGGRIHQIEVRAGRTWMPLLLAPRRSQVLLQEALAWGCYPMVPWPGRIDGGRFLFGGRQHHVPLTPGEPHALHGFGVSLAWRLERHDASSCRLSLGFDGEWEFGGRAVQEIAVEDDAIVLRLEVHATKPGLMPAGAGWHPWFRRDLGRGAPARILVDAERTYETADMIPTGWLRRAVGEDDLRRFAAAPTRTLDACYRHARAVAIAWGNVELRMESSSNLGHAVVHTPPRGICLEPQTCAPDAFNLAAQGIDGCGMAVVAPGRPLVATSTWRWTTT
jgi:aldose 1-epimerase